MVMMPFMRTLSLRNGFFEHFSVLNSGRRSSSLFQARFLAANVSEKDGFRILFFGTDDVATAALKKLHDHSRLEENPLVKEIQVICPSDRKVGKGKRHDPVPVKQYAMKNGIIVHHTPPKLKSLKNWEMPVTSDFDLGVVVSFGYFIHPHMLQHVKHGAINMHPSLLPKYRGPAPIHHALLNGDKTTGVSIIEIDPGAFDVGKILLQKPFNIPKGIRCLELSERLAEFGASCVLETLRNFHELKNNAIVQDDANASNAPKFKHEDGFLTGKETAEQVFHKWQALSDSVGITVKYQHKEVKLIDMRLPKEEELDERSFQTKETTSGNFFFEKRHQAIWLKCHDDTWLLLTKLQLADRKIGNALDFANGYRLVKQKCPSQFEYLV